MDIGLRQRVEHLIGQQETTAVDPLGVPRSDRFPQ
jgi:hypothetical protein